MRKHSITDYTHMNCTQILDDEGHTAPQFDAYMKSKWGVQVQNIWQMWNLKMMIRGMSSLSPCETNTWPANLSFRPGASNESPRLDNTEPIHRNVVLECAHTFTCRSAFLVLQVTICFMSSCQVDYQKELQLWVDTHKTRWTTLKKHQKAMWSRKGF